MPASKLPLLLAAFQYRFGRDLDAMTQHLIDDVAVGWAELGTDFLDGAPPEIIAALTGGDRWASRPLDDLNTPGGPPSTRIAVTETTAADQGLDWGYVLRPHGIEVIPVRFTGAWAGHMVEWDTDPRVKFSNYPGHWSSPPATTPVTTSARPTRAAPATAPVEPRKTARR